MSVSREIAAAAASLPTPAVVALAVLLLASALYLLSASRFAHLPPGPPGVPFFGNTLQIPHQHPWRQLAQWTDEYGPIYTLRLGHTPFIVLGKGHAAYEVLEKRSAASTGRPQSLFAGDLLSGNKRILFLDHTDRWRQYRKSMHAALQNKEAAKYEPIQLLETRVLARDIVNEPEKFFEHAHKYAASVVMTIAYDHPVRNSDDPLLKAVKDVSTTLGKYARPGATLLDSFPFLARLPTFLNPWKRLGHRLHEVERSLFRSVFDDVRHRVATGRAVHNFSSALMDRQDELGLDDDELAYLSGSLFGAGSDTTTASILVFIMAMCHFPEVAMKGQAEVDRVVGADRLPTFADQSELPYVRAIVKETMRWRPVSSGGFAHKLTEDVSYHGWVLPKGASVVGNHWSISLDPDAYPEPDVFRPERFIGPDGNEVGPSFSKDRGHVGFGFGRRICAGQHVAERSLFLTTAVLLWTFNIRPSTDPSTGEPILPDTLAFDSGANSHPLPFLADLRPRSEMHCKVLEKEVAALGL